MQDSSVQDQLQQILLQLQRLEAHHTDPLAQVLLSLVPHAGIIAGMVVLIVFIRHYFGLRRQMIEAGRFPTPTIHYLRSLALIGGILAIASGLPLTVLFLAVEGVSYPLLGGLIPLSIGIGLLIFFVISRTQSEQGR
jgi:hypothetical protein